MNTGSEFADRINYGVDPRSLVPDLSAEDYATALADVEGAVTDVAINLVIGLLNQVVKTQVGGSHIVFAGAGNDVINGHEDTWDDFFDGGPGNDTMSGGRGNDVYVVGDPGDVVIESSGEGIDAVRIASDLDYTLAANVENLFGAGAGIIIGNNLANYLGGNAGNNNLRGGAGNDTLDGQEGDDTLNSDAGVNSLIGGTGNDTYTIDDTDDIIYENTNAGIDSVLFLGLGNDPSDGDTIDLQQREFAGTLFGTVENLFLADSSVTFTEALGDQRVIRTKIGDFSAFGNYLDNFIQGNSGSNLLVGRDGNDTLVGGDEAFDGQDGADTLEGGAGDDTYILLDTSDAIVDIEGNDTVILRRFSKAEIGPDPTGSIANNILLGFSDATLAYELPTNSIIEELVLEEITSRDTAFNPNNVSINQDIDATGGIGNNKITGNSGNNELTARGGSDTLIGGAGDDTLNSDSGVDTSAGAAGGSSLQGNTGNDTYVLYRADDVVTENVNEGSDTIITGAVDVNLLSFSNGREVEIDNLEGSGRSSNIENVQLTGSLDLNVTGDDAANTITGNAGSNLLRGLRGDDTFVQTSETDVVGNIISLLPKEVINYLRYTDAEGNYDFEAVYSLIQNALPEGVGMPNGDAETVLRQIAVRHLELVETDRVINNLSADLRAEYFDSDLVLDGAPPFPFRALLIDVLGDRNITRSIEIFENVQDRLLDQQGLTEKSELDLLIEALPQVLLDILIIDEFESPEFTAEVFVSQVSFLGDLVELLPDGLELRPTVGREVPLDTPVSIAFGTSFILRDISNGGEQQVANALEPGVLASLPGFSLEDLGDDLASIISRFIGNQVSLENGVTDDLIAEIRDRLASSSDTLEGGTGNDTYIIDDRSDVLIERANEGVDTIVATINDHVLQENFEELELGNGVISGIGNGRGGTVKGNNLANYLESGSGIDRLEGGFGDDTYVVNDTGDVVVEFRESGTDKVISSVSISLSDHVENIQLTGNLNLSATGNEQDNVIIGNRANNSLDGGDGADSIVGGLGNDTLFGGQDREVDTLEGGDGDDTYVIANAAFSGDPVRDVIRDTGGNDVVLIPSRLSLTTFTLPDGIEGIGVSDDENSVDFDGNDGANRLVGNAQFNTIRGLGGNDTIIGNGGGDFLFGGRGNDVLSGQHMFDEEGNDTYQISDLSQLIVDLGSGNDTVESSVSFSQDAGLREELIDLLVGNGLGRPSFESRSTSELLAEAQQRASLGELDTNFSLVQALPDIQLSAIENIVLTGEANVDATGGESNEQITGNNANNKLVGEGGNDTLHGQRGEDTLEGGDGVDRLVGGRGDDVYILDAEDTVVELRDEGSDTVVVDSDYKLDISNVENVTLANDRFPGNFNATGDENSNVLTGNGGNNRLDGAGGNDTLIGGAGNDTYRVLSAEDTVIENAGEGIDTIEIDRGVNLTSEFDNIENVLLLDAAGLADLIGDIQNNRLEGNASANILDGGAGRDTLVGGEAPDTYFVDAQDTVIETGSTGGDTVFANFAFDLANHAGIEDLVLTGFDDIDVTGNSNSNRITGNAGANTITGGAGTNNLNGGAGNDTYFISGSDSVAEVADFQITENQTLVADLSTLFEQPETGLLTYRIISLGELGDDTNGLSLDRDSGLLVFDKPADFENPSDSDGDNVHKLLVIADLNGRTYDQFQVWVVVNDNQVEFNNVLAGQGNQKITQVLIDGDSSMVADSYEITSGNDVVTVTDAGEVRFINVQTSPGSFTYELTVTKDSVSNTVVQTVNVLENPTGRVSTLESVSTVDITPTQDRSEDVVFLSNPISRFTLSDFIEQLTLTSSDAEHLVGNDQNNEIRGNSGNDTLDGKGGADTLIGSAGDDTYFVDDVGDVIEESGSSIDTVVVEGFSYTLGNNLENLRLSTGATNGTGNAANNLIKGNTADNTLDGGAGADTLVGNGGNDTYIVDNSSDVISERESGGTDTVLTSLNSFDLTQNSFLVTTPIDIEVLTFTDSGNNTGVGNDSNNIITGNTGNDSLSGGAGGDVLKGLAGNDTLDGGSGNDRLEGGLGDDVYRIDASSDVVVEAEGEGEDTVNASVSYTLSDHVEVLTLTGSLDINATGNALANRIEANTGSNTLQGLAGDDVFIDVGLDDTVDGGEGQDAIRLEGSAQLDLTMLPSFSSIEVIEFENGSNTLTLNQAAVDSVAGGSLTVSGLSSDRLVLNGAWSLEEEGATGADAKTIDVYQFENSETRVNVEQGVDVRIVAPTDSISIDDLDGSNGFSINAAVSDSWYTFDVNAVGDVNGDGFGDVALGLPRAYNGYESGGRAFVIFGQSETFSANVNVSNLDGENGFALAGDDDTDGLATSVSFAGDVNGDGIDDFIVGDPYGGDSYDAGPNGPVSSEGVSYVVFGQADDEFGTSSFGAELVASNLSSGADGFTLRPVEVGARSGRDVSNVGDFNGDGMDDFAISAPYKGHEDAREGSVYIVFGDSNGFDGSFDLETLDGTNGIEIAATNRSNDRFGYQISEAGDVNGDGFDDVVMTSLFGYSTVLVFGTDNNVETIDIDDLKTSEGFELKGTALSISGGGDINGDGFDDLLISSDRAAYVLLGAPNVADRVNDLDYSYSYGDYTYVYDNFIGSLNPDFGGDGSVGFYITESLDPPEDGPSSESGINVAMIGDVNGDGFDDILISDSQYGYREDEGRESGEGEEGVEESGSRIPGKAWVVFGGEDISTGDVAGAVELDALDGTNGFEVTGANVFQLGEIVAAAGDVNGDGFDDFLIAETGGDGESEEGGEGEEGEGGRQEGGGEGEEGGGEGEPREGDVQPAAIRGTAYLIFGQDFAGAAGVVGSSGDDDLTVGVTGVVKAGAGDDTIRINSTDVFRIDGGAGSDSLVLAGSGLNLDLSSQQANAIQNIETIDLTGSGDNTITLNHFQAGRILGNSSVLQINGDAGDTVTLARTTTPVVGPTHTTYTLNNTFVSVANAVTVIEQEFAPVIASRTTILVDENTTFVSDLLARDLNGDALTYSISGADADDFNIDAATGLLLFVTAQDYENPNGIRFRTYEVTVTASDGTGRSDSEDITVLLQDVENEPPAFVTQTQFEVAAGEDNVFVNPVVSDPDDDLASVSISGPDADRFRIVFGNQLFGDAFEEFGEIADADGDRVYEITITATDDEGNESTQDFEFGVTGENRLPQFDAGNSAQTTITEGAALVGTFAAIDFDNDSEVITYGIKTGDDSALFTLDSATGELSFASAPAYSDDADPTANTYRVTLTAEDSQGEAGELILDVTVAYEVTSTPETLSNFTPDNAGEILDFSTLLSSVGAPTDESAFTEGWLNFKSSGGDVIVEFDSDGGGDDYVEILTIEGAAGALQETDTDFLLL